MSRDRALAASLALLLALGVAPTLRGHVPDTSYLRCRVTPRSVELRFTLDPATMFRIARLDADGDGRTTRAEMEAAAPAVWRYLENAVRLEINGVATPLGARERFEWPADAGDAIAEKDYHNQLLHFSFRQDTAAVVEDFYLGYEVFDELGDRHRVIADVEQDGAHHEIVFTLFEPDYLYDTGWKPEVEPAAGVGQGEEGATQRERFRSGVREAWSRWWVALILFGLALGVNLRERGWANGLLLGGGLLLAMVGVGLIHPPASAIQAAGLCAGMIFLFVALLPAAIALRAALGQGQGRGEATGQGTR